MFSKANASSVIDPLVSAAKSARDTLYLLTGTGPLDVHERFAAESMSEQQDALEDHAEDLKKAVAANSSIPLSEEFSEMQAIIKKIIPVFKEATSLMKDCQDAFVNGLAECKNVSEMPDKIVGIMDSLNGRVEEYRNHVGPIGKEIDEMIGKMLKSSSTSWKKTAAYLLLGVCGEIALLTMGCAALLMTSTTAVLSAVTLNPIGLVAAVAATGAILTGMAASLAAIPVALGVAVVNRVKPASETPAGPTK